MKKVWLRSSAEHALQRRVSATMNERFRVSSLQTDVLPRFHQIRNFLPDGEHEFLLSHVLESERSFTSATVFKGTDQVIEGGHRSALKLPKVPPDVREMFSRRLAAVVDQLFVGTGVKQEPIIRTELELVAHNDGDHFNRHIDTLAGRSSFSEDGSGSARFLSCVYYFHREPKSFSGGELQLHSFVGSSSTIVQPDQNSFVAFPAFAPHEVKLVHCPSRKFEDSRFSINCWLHCSR